MKNNLQKYKKSFSLIAKGLEIALAIRCYMKKWFSIQFYKWRIAFILNRIRFKS